VDAAHQQLSLQGDLRLQCAGSGSDFWISEAKLWSKDVDRFADPSKPSTKRWTPDRPTDSELDKAKKLYKAVQALDNTDYSATRAKRR